MRLVPLSPPNACLKVLRNREVFWKYLNEKRKCLKLCHIHFFRTYHRNILQQNLLFVWVTKIPNYNIKDIGVECLPMAFKALEQSHEDDCKVSSNGKRQTMKQSSDSLVIFCIWTLKSRTIHTKILSCSVWNCGCF